MAGGKLTPRQKMINMMYLVLTALLAMNVSKEILNAFKTVNSSIINSNEIIMAKNDDTYTKFEEAAADPQTAEKAGRWKVYADRAKSISDDLYNTIEEYKTAIKVQSGLEIVEGEEVYSYDNLDVASRIMIEEGKGEEVYNLMGEYKTQLLKVINVEDFNDEPTTKESVELKLKELEKSIPISLEIPKSSTGEKYSQDGKGWARGNFYYTPSVASVTILSKLQNDVRASQAQVVDYCFSQIGAVKVVYDAFEVIASANTNYAMPGDPIKIVAGIGAFSEAAKPIISINGQNVPLTGGQAVFETTAAGSGKRSVPVKITYTNPAGEELTVDKTVEYTVGTPSGAAVQFDKMNVIYIGVDNPLTIKSSVGDEKTNVSINGGGATISKKGAGKYIAKATTPTNDGIITVSADGETNKFGVRVKLIPDPIATIGGNKALTISGKTSKANGKAQGAIIPLLENFDFEARFDVVSYDCYLTSGGELFPSRGNSGPYFSDQVKSLWDRAKPGKDVIIFDNIKVRGPDGKPRTIPSMTFQII